MEVSTEVGVRAFSFFSSAASSSASAWIVLKKSQKSAAPRQRTARVTEPSAGIDGCSSELNVEGHSDILIFKQKLESCQSYDVRFSEG